MNPEAMSLKARIRTYAEKNHITAQVVLQNYMFERFLERLSISEYNNRFVIKGGMLVASLVGLDTRSTMDLDTTIQNLPLDEEHILLALTSICNQYLNDNTVFKIKSVVPIRKDDIYGGYNIRLDALFDTIITPLSIDISTGDIITPEAVKYEFSCIFDDNKKIMLWAYNIESVMAEKAETILSRGVFNTRLKDFYDLYILSTTQIYRSELFKEALNATAIHRGTVNQIKKCDQILSQISSNQEIKNMWTKYQKSFDYAKNISFSEIITTIKNLLT